MLFLAHSGTDTFPVSHDLNLDESVQQGLLSKLIKPRPEREAPADPSPRFDVDQSVRLLKDLPEFWLRSGDVGVVICVWCSPMVGYEVEFRHPERDVPTRVLVFPEYLDAVMDYAASEHA